MNLKTQLKNVRGKIDRLDSQILELLSQRASCVQEVGQLKDNAASHYHVPEREAALLRSLKNKNSGPYPDQAIEAIYKEIISASLALESPLKVAFLGPEGTYSHLAAKKKFGASSDYNPEESIRSVFEAVAKQRTDYAVIPIENSTEGSVNISFDLLLEFPLKVCGEIHLPIHHCLIANTKKLKQIKEVLSHPQVLAQCRQWLDKNLAHAKRTPVSSTTQAIGLLKQSTTKAALASEFAAELYKKPILKKNVEDLATNFTRFWVLGNQETEATGQDKTSFVFSIKDRAGQLARILRLFSESRINLSKIESRPNRKKPWEYTFFIDAVAHIKDDKMQQVLKKIKPSCADMRILGSYPQGDA